MDQKQLFKPEHNKQFSITMKEDFKALDSLISLMRSVKAWRTIVFCCRSYDYGPSVVANLLEDVRFLAGVFKSAYKNQRLCLENFINSAIKINNNRYI